MERSPLTERELQTKLLAKIKENPDVISALINIPDELKRSTYDVDVLIAAGYANMNKHSAVNDSPTSNNSFTSLKGESSFNSEDSFAHNMSELIAGIKELFIQEKSPSGNIEITPASQYVLHNIWNENWYKDRLVKALEYGNLQPKNAIKKYLEENSNLSEKVAAIFKSYLSD